MLLFNHPRRSFPNSPADCYCTITTDLRASALQALHTFTWLHDVMNEQGWKDDAHIRFKSRKVAEDRAKLLRDLHLQKQDGVERPANDAVYQDLLVERTPWLRCSIGELLANEADVYALAQSIVNAGAGESVRVANRVRKLVKTILALFKDVQALDPIAAYEPDEVTAAAQTWSDEVLRRHELIMDFLRLFDSRCATEPPKAKTYDGPVHIVHIADLSTMIVDGAPVTLNRAKKAALFTLAVLGCDEISVEEFARLYDDDLYRHPGKVKNFATICAQALTGLKKALPHLTVTKPDLKLRTISGIELTCDLRQHDLREWLNTRTG